MNRIKAVLLIVLSSLVLVTTVGGETKQEDSVELTYREFISQAIEHDAQFKAELQNYLSAKYQNVSAQSIQAWTLSAKVGRIQQESVQGTFLEPQTIQAWNYEASLQKLFVETGTRLQLSHTNMLGDFDYQPGPDLSMLGLEFDQPGQSSTPVFSITLVQPLLKNAFGLMDRYPLIATRLQMEAAQLDVEEAWEGRIQELFQAYHTWTASYETVQALQTIVQDLERLEKQIRDKVRTGMAERVDLLQTQNNVLRYQSALEQAEGIWVNNTKKIQYLMAGKPVDTTMVLRPESKAPDANKQNTVKPIWRLVKKLELVEEQMEAKALVARNSLLPELNLTANYQRKGSSDDHSGGYSSLEQNDYAVKVEASFPLGNAQAKGQVGQAQANQNQVRALLQATQQELTLTQQQLAESIRRLEKITQLQQKQVTIMQTKKKLDQHNFQIGRLDIYFLIETENALTNARLDQVKSDIQLRQLRIAYLDVTDSLLGQFLDLSQRLYQQH
jgi:outer membrane protein